MSNFLKQRVKALNSKQISSTGKSVIYVCSRDQRIKNNHALVLAQKQALQQQLPLIVIFNLVATVGVRSFEHYQFMLEGLKQLEFRLSEKNIPLKVLIGDLERSTSHIQTEFQPAAVYFDFSPFNKSRQQKTKAANQFDCPVYVVDTHNVVPAWVVSDKQEYNAYFFRKKHYKHQNKYLVTAQEIKNHPHTWSENLVNNWPQLTAEIKAPKLSGYQPDFDPGYQAAKNTLEDFLSNRLIDYDKNSNDPTKDVLSNLSPYLHFGQISSLEIALAVEDYVATRKTEVSDKQADKLTQSKDAFLEQLLVRKELSDNYCYYNADYRSLDGLPDWAVKTLTDHEQDPRDNIYSLQQLEQAETHDQAWNAAQTQMMITGKMHGYMRMYWAKKILEWSPNAQTALDHAIYLNDHYSLDGYDPNGYVGILWSIGGLHDRAWQERKIFGKIRYMSLAGLKRKFDLDQYLSQWL